jgi:hypothetical protein
MNTKKACLGVTVGAKEKKKRRWVKKWFKKRHILSHENLFKELEIS